MTVRIGTRGSPLALWQANEAKRLLERNGHGCEIVTIRTTGDRRTDVSLASIGGKGLFVKELEEALGRREIDIAVHSLKDVPSFIDAQFALAAFLERADPRDAWVQAQRRPIDSLSPGARVGTSAPRRRAQLRERYPHLQIEDMRGNVDTRLQKIRDGRYDGGVLAAAGLQRLGRASEITSYFSIDEMTPAAGQGIIALETLTDEARQIAATVDHKPTAAAALCERALLQKFENRLDCYSPIGVHAEIADQTTLRVFFAEGDHALRLKRSGTNTDAVVAAAFDALREVTESRR